MKYFLSIKSGDLKKGYNKNPKGVENTIKKMYPGIKWSLYIF